ncbi:response regulator transcription factor [Oculatella sp. FACHB-28]|uniref:response regulator transcription factor n=1 Tax=Oculatella sp. FACHB-28 TaxID=2692845 RepID=UPI001686CA07|nr:response regulator transcription factor [Oculatella sp. FACHB-28]MBD2057548.1 response regulator transcription factor [Oculatella sp. FACHB-28]
MKRFIPSFSRHIVSLATKEMNQLLTPSPRIFVLDSDDDARPLLKHNLQIWGYSVTLALDEVDALERTQGKGDRFDLILISQVGETIDRWMAIGQKIRQNTVLDSRTPIIVMAERYGADLEGQNIQMGDNEYVTYLEDGQQLKRILQQLCPVY